MELIAAVDLLGGRGVRLRQGRYDDVVEAGDPVHLARRWASAGVGRLHVVDLDGARAGEPRQTGVLGDVLRAARAVSPVLPIQAAGGLRSREAVDTVLELGADAAVLGTAAIERPGFLGACATRWPGRIHASIDVRDGRVALDGWDRVRSVDPLELAARLLDDGAAGIVVTDTGRDGTLGGPNVDLLRSFRDRLPAARLVAAGGVRSIDDLLRLEAAGMDGAIVGMALLAGTLRIEDALASLAGHAASGAAATAGAAGPARAARASR